MKRIKKLTAAAAAFALLLCMLSSGAAGVVPEDAWEPVIFSMDTVLAEPGSDVTVSLNIRGEYEATALTLSLDYDSQLLTRTSGLAAGPVWSEISSQGGSVMTRLNTPGSIGFLAIVPAGSFTSSGVLFSVTFHVSESAWAGADIPLTLNIQQFTYDMLDGTVQQLPHESVAGAVLVTAPTPVGLPGDVNGDGAISFTDVSVLYGFLLGLNSLSPECAANADVDGDGSVTFNDVGALYYFCLGG